MIINRRSVVKEKVNKLHFKLSPYFNGSVVVIPQKIIENYISHRFDLLGSGWVSWNIENKEQDYSPIDWQVDIKSGFRWNKDMWYQQCLNTIGTTKGVDIKVPWELSRLQHLPQMAVYASDKSSEEFNSIYSEINNQVTDFIQNNPVRYGVNWACPMDVGIRMVNILIAFDILNLKSKKELDSNILSSAYLHAKHICQNLEYTKVPNNHYLTNICSLIIISSYLSVTKETTAWLAFGIQELISQVDKQFYSDGGNFEASTSYHCLSTEMVIYALAYLKGLNNLQITALKSYKCYQWKYLPLLKPINCQKWKINKDVIDLPFFVVAKVQKAVELVEWLTKPNGEIPQFGDNDSGKFVRLTPVGNFITNKEAENKYINLKGYCNKVKEYGDIDLFWNENSNNHQNLLALFSGLFHSDNIYFKVCNHYKLEFLLIKNLTKHPYQFEKNKENLLNVAPNYFSFTDFPFSDTIEYSSVNNLQDNISNKVFDDFGIVIFRGKYLYLAINYGSVGTSSNGGHSHNDKLSYELTINNKNIICDPGSYVYSADVSMRHLFRSNKAHQTIIVDNIEQNDIRGLFNSVQHVNCEIINIDEHSVSFALKHAEFTQVREFIIENNKVIINDYCTKKFTYPIPFKYFSDGYGKIQNK